MFGRSTSLAYVFAVFSFAAPAQRASCDYGIKGTVVDATTKEVLPLAAIWVAEAEKGVVTDEKGRFTMNGLCSGTFSADIHYLGYQKTNFSFSLPMAKELVILMNPEQLLIDEVTVQGEEIVPQSTQAHAMLTEKQLARVSGKSLGESLHELPGVSTLKTGPAISKPVINGLHSNRILILNNGLRQEGQQWGAEHAPEIDPMAATRISVLKGAATVRYGPEAIGGLVVVEPPELPYQHRHLHGNIRLMASDNGRMGAASGALEGGIGAAETWAWRMQASTRRAGDFRAPRYYLTNTGLKELAFSASLGFRKNGWLAETYYSRFGTEPGILRSAHIGNLTDLKTALESDRPLVVSDFSYSINNPRQKVTHDLVKINLRRESRIGHLHLVYGFQRNIRQEFDIRRGGRSSKPALDLNLITHSVDFVWEHKAWKLLKGQLGGSVVHQTNRNIPGTGIEPLIPNYNSLTSGLFLIERWIEEKWEVEAGARFDVRNFQVFTFNENDEIIRPVYHFNSFSNTLGLVLKPSSWCRLTSNLGSAWRPPGVNELYSHGVHHGAATLEEGNLALKAEQSFKWVNQLQITRAGWSANISLYGQLIDNYIYLKPQPEPRLTIRGAFPVYGYEQTDVSMAGIDALVTLSPWPRWSYSLKGSLIRARDVSENNYLIFMPGDRALHQITWTYPFKDLRTFYVTAAHSLVLKQTRYPKGVDFVDPPDGYQLVSLSLGYGAQLFNNNYEVGLEVTNLLDTSYREYQNRLRYYADELGRTISIRFNYKF